MVNVIKKVNVPPLLLAELDWESEGYLIRYRIISESRNTRSHWSPVYQISAGLFENVVGSYREPLGEDGQTNVAVTWDDLYNRPKYDIFIEQVGSDPYGDEFEYDGSSFHYHGTSATHNYSFIKKTGTSYIRIIIQPASNIKKIKENFIIYDSDNPIVTES